MIMLAVTNGTCRWYGPVHRNLFTRTHMIRSRATISSISISATCPSTLLPRRLLGADPISFRLAWPCLALGRRASSVAPAGFNVTIIAAASKTACAQAGKHLRRKQPRRSKSPKPLWHQKDQANAGQACVFTALEHRWTKSAARATPARWCQNDWIDQLRLLASVVHTQ